ncbi:MAG: (S)-ureidoglycine aminohydrolase [Synergistaceae bacterium]|jgi:(S)-ureidoglycine aminohydrolase|nr:(S)-ureidoglycine aminohydrolase [Synergistaceae bacterium]
MGYPKGNLVSRAIVKPGVYTVIPPEGRVLNVLPHFEGFSTTILASPKYGASFVFYVSSLEPGAKTAKTWCGEEGIESFVYFMDEEKPGGGKLTVRVGGEEKTLSRGGYAYAPAGTGMDLSNSGSKIRVLLYKQRYIPIEGAQARTVWGNVNDIQERIYDDMANVFIQDLLPMDLGFDMNFHILSFEPAGSHPFIETHVQEHGAYILSGQGVYMLEEDYVQVQKEDFIWFGPFAKQAVYATGRERLSYIYSKDFNRDVQL